MRPNAGVRGQASAYTAAVSRAARMQEMPQCGKELKDTTRAASVPRGKRDWLSIREMVGPNGGTIVEAERDLGLQWMSSRYEAHAIC
jgi:hypothetical protein